MSQLKVRVSELIGDYRITLEDGQQVYDVIHPEPIKGRPVELDFCGMEIFAAPFFNAAFGRLVEDVSPERLDELLQIRNLIPDAERTLRRVIKNWKEYRDNPKLREAFTQVINKRAENN